MDRNMPITPKLGGKIRELNFLRSQNWKLNHVHTLLESTCIQNYMEMDTCKSCRDK